MPEMLTTTERLATIRNGDYHGLRARYSEIQPTDPSGGQLGPVRLVFMSALRGSNADILPLAFIITVNLIRIASGVERR